MVIKISSVIVNLESIKRCGICHTKDNDENMAECLRCGKLFCDTECHEIHTGYTCDPST